MAVRNNFNNQQITLSMILADSHAYVYSAKSTPMLNKVSFISAPKNIILICISIKTFVTNLHLHIY